MHILSIDLVGMIISIGIIWGIVPNDSIPNFAKVGLTLFFIVDHLGLIPTIGLIFKDMEDNEND